MSDSLGPVLPGPLVDRLAGRDLARYAHLAVPVLTVDAGGWPHVALLSYSEVIARDAQTLRIAVGGTSTSADNLRRSGHVTLMVLDARVVFYVKGTAREHAASLAAAPWTAAFDVRVSDVLADAADPRREGESFLTSGITFAGDPSWTPTREAVLGEIRAS